MTLRQRVDWIIKTTLAKHNGNVSRTAAELAISVRMVRYTLRRFEREQQAWDDEQKKRESLSTPP